MSYWRDVSLDVLLTFKDHYASSLLVTDCGPYYEVSAVTGSGPLTTTVSKGSDDESTLLARQSEWNVP